MPSGTSYNLNSGFVITRDHRGSYRSSFGIQIFDETLQLLCDGDPTLHGKDLWRRKWVTIAGGSVLLLTALAIETSNQQGPTSTIVGAAVNPGGSGAGTTAAAPQTPAEVVCGMDPQDLRAKSVAVNYKQLIKDPGSFQGTFAKFTGKILQIAQSGNTGVLRLSVTDEGYGIWSSSDVVWVEYNQATNAVEGDIVTVYGMLNGTQTYTSEANYQITLPDLVACAIGAIPPSTSPSSGRTASSQQTQGSASPSQSQPAQPTEQTYTTPSGTVVNAGGQTVGATWHTVYTINGETQTKTPPFTLQGTQQRITYSCSQIDSTNSFSMFNGVISSTDGSASDVFAPEVSCPGSNATYEYFSSGHYYLDLDGSNAHYTVTVEDYY